MSKLSAAHLQLAKDLEKFKLCSQFPLIFPNPNDIMHFIVRIKPNEGYYSDHNFDFKFDISENWPFEKPKVTLLTRIWHPNIDLQGNICLDIIREQYTPVLTILQIAESLLFLLKAPNPYSSLNDEAADQLINNVEEFKQTSKSYMDEFCTKE